MLYVICAVIAICTASVITGLMLAIGSILGPYWLTLQPDAFVRCFKINSHAIKKVIPCVAVPCLVALAASTLLARQRNELAVGLWLASTGAMLLVLMATFGWFVPQNTVLLSNTLSAEQITKRLRVWLMLHQGRVIVAASSSVLAVLALRQSGI